MWQKRSKILNEWMLEHFIDRLNAECDTLLDNGDYDYLDCEKWIQLYAAKWFERSSKNEQVF